MALAVQALQAGEDEPHHPDSPCHRGRLSGLGFPPGYLLAKIDRTCAPLYSARYYGLLEP